MVIRKKPESRISQSFCSDFRKKEYEQQNRRDPGQGRRNARRKHLVAKGIHGRSLQPVAQRRLFEEWPAVQGRHEKLLAQEHICGHPRLSRLDRFPEVEAVQTAKDQYKGEQRDQ